MRRARSQNYAPYALTCTPASSACWSSLAMARSAGGRQTMRRPGAMSPPQLAGLLASGRRQTLIGNVKLPAPRVKNRMSA
jgi:hypothetical protein